MGWIVLLVMLAVAFGLSIGYDQRVRRRGGRVRSAGQMTSETVANHLDNNAMNEVREGMTGIPIAGTNVLKAPKRDFSGN